MAIKRGFPLLSVSILPLLLLQVIAGNTVGDSIKESPADLLYQMVELVVGDTVQSDREILEKKDSIKDRVPVGKIIKAEAKIPEELIAIVGNFYLQKSISEKEAAGMLDFVTEAFSEHEFHESGSWAKPGVNYRYVPYKGELPSYTHADFRMPVRGRLTSGYGYRPAFGKFHKGIDVSLNPGDTVRSALPGVVTRVAYDTGGYGHFVVVSHAGGIETLYGHLGSSIVSPGDKLVSGSPLGIGGLSGNSTGPHLHFETRYRGSALDPISWFEIEGLR